jgi:hypothetical protein
MKTRLFRASAGLANLDKYLAADLTPTQTFADAYAQDDTDFDYVKQPVWYY